MMINVTIVVNDDELLSIPIGSSKLKLEELIKRLDTSEWEHQTGICVDHGGDDICYELDIPDGACSKDEAYSIAKRLKEFLSL